jgi:hypothetical protein
MHGGGCSAGAREAATIQIAIRNGRRHVSCARKSSQIPILTVVLPGATETLRTARVVMYHSDVEEIAMMTRHAAEGKPS